MSIFKEFTSEKLAISMICSLQLRTGTSVEVHNSTTRTRFEGSFKAECICLPVCSHDGGRNFCSIYFKNGFGLRMESFFSIMPWTRL